MKVSHLTHIWDKPFTNIGYNYRHKFIHDNTRNYTMQIINTKQTHKSKETHDSATTLTTTSFLHEPGK